MHNLVMRQLLILFMLPLLLPAEVFVGGGFDHSAWQGVLDNFTGAKGQVDYEALQANPEGLRSYVEKIAKASPENRPEMFPTPRHELAYWLNAYNALTVWGVVQNYPVSSVREIGLFAGSFRNQDFVVGGSPMTLNHIEHGILRKRFRDPRIHFAITYAAAGGPGLPRKAFSAAGLEESLDELTSRFVNRRVRWDKQANLLTVHRLFDWYQQDFERTTRKRGEKAILAFLRPYSSEGLNCFLDSNERPEVSFSNFDWRLNETPTLLTSNK